MPRWLFSWLPLAALTLLVVACSAVEKRDGPGVPISADQVRRLQPVPESPAKYGNHSPYEVYGRQYTVMKSAKGYVQRGVASWYGSKFHGRRTSSGEPYDMYVMTAAHRSLPLPTWVEVTNLDNGRSAVVKVNDRGPFAHNRLLDLSYGAAVVLGVKKAGTARVEVRSIDFVGGQPVIAGKAPPAQPVRPAAVVASAVPVKTAAAKPRSVPAVATAAVSAIAVAAVASPSKARQPLRPSAGSQRLFLQLGAFADQYNAFRLRGELTDGAGLNGVHVSQLLRGGTTLFRVRMGPFASRGALDTAVVELRRAGVDGYRVINE